MSHGVHPVSSVGKRPVSNDAFRQNAVGSPASSPMLLYSTANRHLRAALTCVGTGSTSMILSTSTPGQSDESAAESHSVVMCPGSVGTGSSVLIVIDA